MRKLLTIALLQVGAATADAAPPETCAKELGATEVANRLSEVPTDILADLFLIDKGMGDRGSPLLQTDAPSAEQLKWPTTRFLQAMLISRTWYAQIEVSMMSGVRTMGYSRGSDGRLQRSRAVYLGGPACETLRAAVNGVYNPGNLNF